MAHTFNTTTAPSTSLSHDQWSVAAHGATPGSEAAQAAVFAVSNAARAVCCQHSYCSWSRCPRSHTEIRSSSSQSKSSIHVYTSWQQTISIKTEALTLPAEQQMLLLFKVKVAECGTYWHWLHVLCLLRKCPKVSAWQPARRSFVKAQWAVRSSLICCVNMAWRYL